MSRPSDTLVTSIGDLVLRASMAGVLLVLGKTVSSSELGGVATAFTLASVILFTVELGTSWGVVQIASTSDEGQPRVIGAGLVIKGLSLIVGVVLTMCVASLAAFDTHLRDALPVGMMIAAGQSLLVFIARVVSPRGAFRVPAVMQVASGVILIGGTLLGHATVGALTGLLLASAAVLFGAVSWALTTWRQLATTPNRDDIVRLIRVSVPYALSAWMVAVLFKVDVLFLAAHVSSAAAGTYDLLYKLTTFSLIVPTAMNRVYLPELFRHRDAAVLRAGSRALLGYGAAVAALLLLAGPLLLGVLPADVHPLARSIVRWLPLYLVIRCSVSFMGDAITGAGRQADRVRIQIAAAMVNVVMNAALVPALGVQGAIVATMGSEFVLAVGYVMVGNRLPHARGAVPIAQVLAFVAAILLASWMEEPVRSVSYVALAVGFLTVGVRSWMRLETARVVRQREGGPSDPALITRTL